MKQRNNEKYTCKSWSILWLQVGKGNVHTALSLIGFEKDLQAAMEFVFGSAFVCNDMNTAKKVTFDDRIMKKSVTLEGDSFDPAGTLTGGRLTLYGYLIYIHQYSQYLSPLNFDTSSLIHVQD